MDTSNNFISNNWDKIPEDDQHWQCFLLLLEVLQYSTARITSISSAKYLSALIEQHHHEFKKCYPSKNMPPKMHYIFQLKFKVKLCIYFNFNYRWMLMETKKSYFKKVGRISNFKNVAYSVAHHHQRLLCAYLQCGHFFTYEELQCGPCKIISYIS